MAMKAFTVPLSPSSSSSSSSKRSINDVVCVCRTRFLGTMSSKLPRSRSVEFNSKQRVSRSNIRRVCSATFDAFSDEKFSLEIQEFTSRLQFPDAGEACGIEKSSEYQAKPSDSSTRIEMRANSVDVPVSLRMIKRKNQHGFVNFDAFSDEKFSPEIQELASRLQFPDAVDNSGFEDASAMESRWPKHQSQPPDWASSIEMRANSVDLPVSLRMIKRKKQQWQGELVEDGESAYCSIKKAFSSMVFIIRELHSFTLRMRELLFDEDMQGTFERVKREIHISFVWLFQQVFSHTPALMVYIMILLANFTVYSLSFFVVAVAATAPSAVTEGREISSITSRNFEASSIVKSYSVSSWVKAMSVNLHRPILSESVSPLTAQEEEEEEETELWNSMVEEASRMHGEGLDEALLDRKTRQRFVSPVSATIDIDNHHHLHDYHRTEVLYQNALAQDPHNVLLLANYAQFLYLVAHDYDRAEEYFKKAINVEPNDAEAHSKYAHFLWQVRNDLWAAEETFLEAISADPSNSFYAANYAHFLWSTGGEDTCFPLNDDDDEAIDNA